jgi:putative transposase
VVGLQAKREAVTVLMHERGMRVTRACGLVGISRALYGYQAKRSDDGELRTRIESIAAQKHRYGYRRIQVLLRREGWSVNVKRTYRLYREAGLAVRRRKHKRSGSLERQPLPLPQAPNVSWSMDFVADRLAGGRGLRCLAIVDNFSRECLAIEVDTSITGTRVKRVLEHLRQVRGLPRAIRVDNGPEFAGKILDAWAYERKVQLAFIRPGKPIENAYIESFNGRFRDECLNEHWFFTIDHARAVIEAWRNEYNEQRSHSSLNYLTPTQFATQARENSMLENVVSLTPDSMTHSY